MLYQLSYGRQLPAGVAEKRDRFKRSVAIAGVSARPWPSARRPSPAGNR